MSGYGAVEDLDYEAGNDVEAKTLRRASTIAVTAVVVLFTIAVGFVGATHHAMAPYSGTTVVTSGGSAEEMMGGALVNVTSILAASR